MVASILRGGRSVGAAVVLAGVVLSAPTAAPAADAPAKGSRPAAFLTPMERADFALGQALFERPWANGLTGSSSSDGLGPLFNARACSDCHGDAGRSNAVVDPAWSAPHLILEVMTDTGPHPILGKQLQDRASPGIAAEGTARITTATTLFTYADGDTVPLHRPVVTVALSEPSAAPDPAAVDFAPRVAPQLWTGPALEAVPEAQILAWADPDDADGDGISGRIRRVYSLAERRPMVGRFGWKATTPTLPDQIANAFATDMGLSNPLILADAGDCTPAQEDCGRAAAFADDPGEEVEVRAEVFDLVVAYDRGLAAPAFTGDAALRADGLARFDALGCGTCHRHRFDAGTSGIDPNHPTPPFTDLLLHDLGPGLADSRPQGSVAAAEWRTAPLRGLGQTRRSNPRAGYLHDGRALSVEQAILWHGGEADAARDAFAALTRDERERFLAFLRNL